ncbi:uncharacterized protein LOC107016664 [Solanum pennellii]|uniref:Uncharacterized protein LOC107016664 n=1 Tax=Solanum pennellii TaxID=28526 RepID=A0ABM1GKX4_SOLPN|nr:uncharacterized protein LOC107016664 [Solanum pennellii]
MVKDMRSRISLFVAGLRRASSKEGRASMLIGDMDISRQMIYVQQMEEEKMKDREEYRNKEAKTRNASSQPKAGCFKSGQEGHFIREFPNNKQGGENPGNKAQSLSVVPPSRDAHRGAASGTDRGANRLYACYH